MNTSCNYELDRRAFFGFDLHITESGLPCTNRDGWVCFLPDVFISVVSHVLGRHNML